MGPFSPVLKLTEGMSMTAQLLPDRLPAHRCNPETLGRFYSREVRPG